MRMMLSCQVTRLKPLEIKITPDLTREKAMLEEKLATAAMQNAEKEERILTLMRSLREVEEHSRLQQIKIDNFRPA